MLGGIGELAKDRIPMTEIEKISQERTQRIYARLGGFLFLAVILWLSVVASSFAMLQ